MNIKSILVVLAVFCSALLTKAQGPSLTIGEAFNWQVGDTLIYRPFYYYTYRPQNAPEWVRVQYFGYGGLVGFNVISKMESTDTTVYQVRYFDSLSVDTFVITDVQLPIDSMKDLGGFKKLLQCNGGANFIHGLPYFKQGEYYDSTFNDMSTVRFKSVGDYMFDILFTENVGIRSMDFTWLLYLNEMPGGCGAALAYYKSDSVEWRDQIVYNWVGIHDISMEEEVSIYPNPVNDIFYLKSESNIKNIAIYDLAGQQILSVQSTSGTIDISHLPAGSYVANIETINANSIRKRLIKL